MGKIGIKADGETRYSSPKIKSYSVDEIFAAGGATAFANKIGKDSGSLLEILKSFSKEDFLTDEEAEIAFEMLRENK